MNSRRRFSSDAGFPVHCRALRAHAERELSRRRRGLDRFESLQKGLREDHSSGPRGVSYRAARGGELLICPAPEKSNVGFHSLRPVKASTAPSREYEFNVGYPQV